MAAKYQLITELYQRTGAAVSRNPQAWQNFLSSACRNYKCRFDEQLLIFAQRPDATAVTTLETWNKQFKRWVNKDSRGIAVFDTKGRRNTLKYYFDVSDTHEGYYHSRPVPIWQMNEQYEQAVIERLSDRFGDLESEDLGEALMQTAKNAVEDNLPDYLAELKDCTKDSFLEELDDFNVKVMYKRLAVNSVTFMLMSRCGLDTGEYFETEDFSDIINFNTPATINAIGLAIVAMFKGDKIRGTLIDTALFGAIFVLVCDIIGRIVIKPYELPIELIVGILGSIIFIGMLLYRLRYGRKAIDIKKILFKDTNGAGYEQKSL